MNKQLKEQYQRLWSRQLIKEFEDICWSYNVQLDTPAIEISNAKKRLGSWHPDSRTIKISSLLILEHSWSVTLNVLKHEMAHQYCTDTGNGKTAHGPDFQKACILLGVPKEYRPSSGDLPENIESLHSSSMEAINGRRLLGKIEKLLALAQSPNENEAALAMAKANEMIQKYNVNMTEEQRRYKFAIINHKKKRIEGWQRVICLILRDFFFVKTVLAHQYDPLSDQTHKTIELLGSNANVTVAEHCYFFLENQISSLWQLNRTKFNGSARIEKNSYYLGLLHGFYDQLNRQNIESKKNRDKTKDPAPQQHTVSAVTVAGDKELNQFIEMKFPKLKKTSRTGPKVYKQTYNQGIETGKKIILNKGIDKQEGYRGKLLN